MPRYVIWACENIYGGLHGMNYQGVVEAYNERDALDFAREEAIELIHSYESIEDALEEDVQEQITPQMTEDEIERLREEVYEEDLEYACWLIDETKAYQYSTLELDDKCWDIGYSDFIEEFC